jgi:type IV pilus assembly protein PilA
MGGNTMKIKKKKGFTLIELLIVVAIIAILAAIAIPQFSSYRIRGYNSAALADLRNGRTAEEAFFSDWQAYASTAAGGVPGTGANYVNTTGVIAVAAGAIATNTPSAATQISFGVSQNVIFTASTSTSGGSFVTVAKNTAGNKCYGMDSDDTAIYWADGGQNTAITGGYATVNGGPIDLVAAGPAPACTGAWGKL